MIIIVSSRKVNMSNFKHKYSLWHNAEFFKITGGDTYGYR